jgi:HTH-type transcriptional regulator/antitoxin HigA
MEVPQPTVSRLINDEKPMDAVTALRLSEVLDTPAERFLELQHSYDLGKARLTVRPDSGRATRAKLLSELPVREMIRRGWLNPENSQDVRSVETELARFFGVKRPEEIEILPHAAKRTNVVGAPTPAQIAWLYRVRQIAQNMLVPRYATDALLSAVKQLSALLASPEEARKVPRILSESGVRFLVVESLPAAKIDGVCFWLNDKSPVIALSMRFDRIDNFWFVLRHEIEHVLRGHGRSSISLDTDLEHSHQEGATPVDDEESVANWAASNFLVPTKTLMQFIARKSPIFTERDILAFSKMLQVHPGLIAGQLQRHTNRYDRFREHLVKVRDVVLPHALHDGWGDVAPVELLS